MRSKHFAAAVWIALCSSSVLAIGVGSRLTVEAVAGQQAPTLAPGNLLTELKFAPVIGDGTLGFIAKRSGPQTGAGGVDHAVYLRGLNPQSPYLVVAESDFAPLAAFRMLLNVDTISASLLAVINTTNGPQNALITSTQAGSTVRAQTGMVVPGTGGRVLKTIDDVLIPRPADRFFLGGDIGFPAMSGEFGRYASNGSGLKPVLLPGQIFNPRIGPSCAIDYVDRALLGSGTPDALGLVVGGALSQGGAFGPFVGRVRIPLWDDPIVTPIVIPGQASPSAFVSGTIEAVIDFAVGPTNKGAVTTLVKSSTLPTEYTEQTGVMDISSLDPLGTATLLLSPHTAVVATPSTAGAVPIGTVEVSHYDRIFFSGFDLIYIPVWVQFPNFESRVVFASGVQSRAARAASGSPLVTELRALLITQGPAPGLTGPKVQSLDKFSASDDGYAVVEVTLSGTGVNSGNNKAWYMCTPSGEVVLVVREGQSIEVSPGVFKVLNAVAFHSDNNTGDGLPNSMGSNGRWAFQADLGGNTTTAIIVATIEGDCPADLNGDGFVEDADFVIFLAAYNILDCLDPNMASGCPSDLNSDGLVEDADFVVFVAAYNELVCP